MQITTHDMPTLADIPRLSDSPDDAFQPGSTGAEAAPGMLDASVGDSTQTLIDRGDFARAAELALLHWQMYPASPAAAFNCGYALQMAGRHGEAIVPYRSALELAPTWPSLKNNLALAIRLSGGDPDIEHALIESALDDDPHDPKAWTNAVVTRLNQFDLDGAQRAAARAVSLAPDCALAANNAAAAFKEAQQWDEAERQELRACTLEPDDPKHRYNLSLVRLARGDFASGWADYEARWDGAGELSGTLPMFHRPRWRGESLEGKTLLVWGEQGLGDVLQFSRYVPLLAARVRREGGRIVWNTFPQMGALIERSHGDHADILDMSTRVEQLPDFDYELPLMSIPWMLGLDADALVTSEPYLHADTRAIDAWRNALAGERRMKVGLAWTGNRAHQRNRFRRVGLERYADAFGDLQRDVAFFSLQPGAQHDVEATRSAGFEVADMTREWKTLDDTASFIGALDLVITVCTSVAHLSGALGQFTWTLLDANPHWVWQHDRRDSPFYPNVSLYRQRTFADWQPVLDEAAADLRDLVG
ncbi:TPR repeat-containing protein [Burkholderia lata]|uniref:TPR repeat-containing protein n=1 Tax=Burkholderia lata (strain ATCC 17760 / DSM 23089 / LMG 22485 / NCIMB 9086 / R18194 / 383) TaxID=482957 RepID=A0A6P2YEH4_BURL3|nr:tetratricopeptide repeat-containing glycosyltransferase family protein [Burkholderia lata]VWD20682.1 TPR repeat-containing protein [Burkholderia lata]